MRDTFKAQNPGMTFGQLSKFTSSMYSQITPQEKKEWEDRAEADKQRYIQQLSVYVPPPGFDAKGDALTVQNAPYVPNNIADKPFYQTPKRCLPAYMLFQNAMRDQFRRENPAMTFGELSSYTSQKYKQLTPEEKASWQQLAEEDKARYEHEKNMFYPTYNHVAVATATNKRSRSGKKPKPVKDRAAPKRARGAYVFFANHIRPLIMQQNPTIDFKEMGVIMGERWRSLTLEERAPYEAMATSDKERFRQEMLEYNSSISRTMNRDTMPPMNPMHMMNPELPYATEMASYPNDFAHSINQHEYAQSLNPDDYAQPYAMQSYGAVGYDNINPNNYYYDPYSYHGNI